MKRIFIQRFFILAVLMAVGTFVGYNAKTFDAWGYSSTRQPVKNQAAALSLAAQVNVDPTKLYKVTEVVDGDTIKTEIDGHEITVRLLGMNTPEVVDPRKPVECYGPEASAETKSLLKGGQVKLVLNPKREKTDKYGRLLAFVYRDDGLFINEFLVKEGFAREFTVGKPYIYQSEFRAYEAAAKQSKLGLWGACL